MYGSWQDGIFSAYRTLAERVVIEDEIRLHSYAAAVTSSQMFALNLFLPFRDGRRDTLEEELIPVVGTRMTIERLAFEWIPPGAILGELDGDRPASVQEHATAVDVVAWGRLASGQSAAALLEVKLGEGGFTPCNGLASPGNTRPDVCASAQRLFADPASCYLQRPARKARDRRYWAIFAEAYGSMKEAFPGVDQHGACPFAGNNQQPMRNLAVARGLEQAGIVSNAYFGLCAHDENPDVSEHWESWRRLLPTPNMAASVPASAIVRAGRRAGLTEWADWMVARYRIPNAPTR